MFRKLFEAFFGEAKSVDVSAWDEQGRGSKALCYIRTAQRKKLASGALALARTKNVSNLSDWLDKYHAQVTEKIEIMELWRPRQDSNLQPAP
ncbi:hypothetical protein [Pseudophaeobacter arcticus]|jgi:hypothetical protein|uniref:hypothetical protein n=1 Tax=Pseudophaeobacter arcticus TaxID=385492 RepID=UPI003A9881E2